MAPADLAALVRAAATTVLAERGLGRSEASAQVDGQDFGVIETEINLVRPRRPEHGDYATGLALRASARLGVSSRELADRLATELAARPGIVSAEVAGPGFVNLRVADEAAGALVGGILAAGERYGAGLVPSRLAVPAELAAAVGVDAARYALVAGLDDRALLTRRTEANPVFRVQHAHARLAGLASNAAELGMAPGADYALLTEASERALIQLLGEYPLLGAPHRVPRYLDDLAAASHRFSDSCQVLPMAEEPITNLLLARLALCAATRQVLANGLDLLGMHAPERL